MRIRAHRHRDRPVVTGGSGAPLPHADRPPEQIVGDPLELHRHTHRDRDALIEAVNRSLDELRPWMPWAQMAAATDSIAEFLDRSHRSWERGLEFGYAMRSTRPLLGHGKKGDAKESGDGIIGCCGLHLRSEPGVIEIGYWVRTDRTGAGVATAAASALTRAALDLPGVERIEIHCDVANGPSRAVPPKLGFRLDRIEHRAPETPGQTDQNMIWVHAG